MKKTNNPSNTRIVFFGNERLATGVTTNAPTLRSLIRAGYDVAAIVSHHTHSSSRNVRDLEIATVSARYGIPLLLPQRPADVMDQLKALKPDIGVLVAYGKIVPTSVIDLFPRGIINIHPSLLPLHRGPIPIESVILEGTRATGVSIMQLVKAMDAGPVYGQTRMKLDGDETKQDLADMLLRVGGESLLRLLPGIFDRSCQPVAQDDLAATYDALIKKDDGMLDFQKPAERLEREVRAYLEWPKSRATLGDGDKETAKEVVITAAHVEPDGVEQRVEQDISESDSTYSDNVQSGTTQSDTVQSNGGTPGSLWHSGKQLGIHTSKGILVIDRLKPAGKQEMTATAFLAGYGHLLG